MRRAEYTRIVLELNGAVPFQTGSLPGEVQRVLPRIYIDLQGPVSARLSSNE
ncbi:MAG: hypothetical protein R2864_04760 [Syntrophotaleaceae bacterium]